MDDSKKLISQSTGSWVSPSGSSGGKAHDDLNDSVQVILGIELDLDLAFHSPFEYLHLGPQKFSQCLLVDTPDVCPPR